MSKSIQIEMLAKLKRRWPYKEDGVITFSKHQGNLVYETLLTAIRSISLPTDISTEPETIVSSHFRQLQAVLRVGRIRSASRRKRWPTTSETNTGFATQRNASFQYPSLPANRKHVLFPMFNVLDIRYPSRRLIGADLELNSKIWDSCLGVEQVERQQN